MELVTVEVKLPKEIYDKASEILAKQGLTMENALSLFFEETVRLGRISPLSIRRRISRKSADGRR